MPHPYSVLLVEIQKEVGVEKEVVDGLKEGRRGPTRGAQSEISFPGSSQALLQAQGRCQVGVES